MYVARICRNVVDVVCQRAFITLRQWLEIVNNKRQTKHTNNKCGELTNINSDAYIFSTTSLIRVAE